jgi:hypothetical protein
MSKTLSALENYTALTLPDTELLMRIKLFLKITRLVVDNSKSALEEVKSEKEAEFFSM